MKFKFRFSILTLMSLTAVIAHTYAKRNVAGRLATPSGTVDSTWIPFVIQVRVPVEQVTVPSEQSPIPLGSLYPKVTSVTTNYIDIRRYAGFCGMYLMVSSDTREDFSKPFLIQMEGYHYSNRSPDARLEVSSP